MSPIKIGYIALLLALWFLADPLVHLAFVMCSCFIGWLAFPKQVGRISGLTCLALMLFGHLGWLQGLEIMFSHPVRLLVVGCLISEVIVKNEIHLLIASSLMKWFSPSTEFTLSIVLFFSSGFLSMWISNTSAVAMLIPVVVELAVILSIEVSPMLLAIAYGATIGGMLTPIGTPANLVAIAYADRYFGIHLSFAKWFMWTAPFVAILSGLMVIYFYGVSAREKFNYEVKPIHVEMSQIKIISGLTLCILLWATQTIWTSMIGIHISEEWVGALFLLACGWIQYHEDSAFHWTDVRFLPLSSIALVVAGIFMADAMMGYNVVELLTSGIQSEDPFFQRYQILTFFGFGISMMTELCSNTAVTSLALPLSSVISKLSNLDIISAVLLITLSANSAFMLPTATPPNALILGTGKISSRRLMLVGLGLSLCSLAVLILLFV